jgi:hypothetical protein
MGATSVGGKEDRRPYLPSFSKGTVRNVRRSIYVALPIKTVATYKLRWNGVRRRLTRLQQIQARRAEKREKPSANIRNVHEPGARVLVPQFWGSLLVCFAKGGDPPVEYVHKLSFRRIPLCVVRVRVWRWNLHSGAGA